MTENAVNNKLGLIEVCDKISSLLGKYSSNDSLKISWEELSGTTFTYRKGIRWSVDHKNLYICYQNYEKFLSFLNEKSATSAKSKQLLLLVKKVSNFREKCLISSFVFNLNKGLWDFFGKKRKISSLLKKMDEINHIKDLIDSNRKTFRSNTEDFFTKLAIVFQSEERLNDLKPEITDLFSNEELFDLFCECLDTSLSKFLEFKWLVQNSESKEIVVSANNLISERSFSLIKYFERRFCSMNILNSCGMGMAKANNLPAFLDTIDDQQLKELISVENKTKTRKNLKDLFAEYKEIAKSNRNFIQKRRDKKDEKLKDAIELLKEAPHLIPESRTSEEACRKKVNETLKARKLTTVRNAQFRKVLMLTLSDLVEVNDETLFKPEYFAIPNTIKVSDKALDVAISIYKSSITKTP